MRCKEVTVRTQYTFVNFFLHLKKVIHLWHHVIFTNSNISPHMEKANYMWKRGIHKQISCHFIVPCFVSTCQKAGHMRMYVMCVISSEFFFCPRCVFLLRIITVFTSLLDLNQVQLNEDEYIHHTAFCAICQIPLASSKQLAHVWVQVCCCCCFKGFTFEVTEIISARRDQGPKQFTFLEQSVSRV